MKNLHIMYAAALCATFTGYAVAVFAQTGGGTSGGSGTMTGTPSGGTVNSTPGMHTSGTPGSTNGTASLRTGPTATTTTGAVNTSGIDGSASLRTQPVGPNGTATSWNSESAYWQNQFSSRPYYNGTGNYQAYQPAYQFGFNSYTQYGGRPYQDLNQQQLRSQWEHTRGTSNLSWDQAQPAIRDEYNRLYNNTHNSATSPAAAAPAR